jgi:gamma-glutamyltranspeptidase/glutathione hydrolase
MRNFPKLYILVFLQFIISCKSIKNINFEEKKSIELKNGMVVSARIEASKIGVEILKKGGNAFDAMIATELSLAVAYPFAGSIGGGGFMVFRKSNGEIGSLDYREKAPNNSSKDMFLDENHQVIPNLSTKSALSIGVPGTIAGIFEVHKKFGKLPLHEMINPVIQLAEKGVVVTKRQEKSLNKYRNEFININGTNTFFAKEYKEGDTIKYPVLAKTLRKILKNGRDEFYKGEIAQQMVSYIEKNGGIVSLDDLANYQAIWRKPITFNYKDLKIISMPPPSSGGITLGQIMKMIEPFPLKEYKHNQTQYIQLLVEAQRRAYSDRNHYLGDPDFNQIPIDELLNPNYLKNRMSNFSFKNATPSKEIPHGEVKFNEKTETTHYSIVDKEGNAISATTTLNDAYGSKFYCDELGFFFNNEMDDFSAKPNTPNMFGLIGSEANSIAPNKRMLSSMTPTIVEKKGKLFLIVGSPGGSTIITSVLQTILNVYEFNKNMQEAVSVLRFHHQWLPDEVIMEPNGFSKKTINKLIQKKYLIKENTTPIIGKVNAIKVLENGIYQSGADPRGDEAAFGY